MPFLKNCEYMSEQEFFISLMYAIMVEQKIPQRKPAILLKFNMKDFDFLVNSKILKELNGCLF